MHIQKTAASSYLRFTGLLLALAYLVWMNIRNQLPVDAGDGILHYSIAREAWNEPFYFLDHWGKPLFTLFSSAFAQFGFKAYVIFNLLVFAANCLLVFTLFRRLKVSTAYYLLFPLLLLCVPDYAYCVLGGMTEPLFGLLLTGLILLAFSEKWLLFATLASFAPFARSEGMLVIVLAVVLLLLVRQWKALPLLLTGFLIYALAGWMLLDSPWWYFVNDPYPEKSIYGTGPWYYYLSTWKNHFGLITLALLPFGMFGCIVLWKKQLVPNFMFILLFGCAIYGGIVAIHSYFWAFGLKGSAGLTRIATLGLPVILLFIILGCDFVSRELTKIPHFIAGLTVSLLIIKEIGELPYPLKANPLEKMLIDAADYAHAKYPGKRIYYFHPLIPWRLNAGIKDMNSNLEQRYFNRLPHAVLEMQPGGILIRDPQFGPVEQGLPLDFVDSFKLKLLPVKVFRTKEPYSVYTGEKVEVVVYQVQP
jgi:hypothetical protein